MPVIATLVRNILLIQLAHGLIGGIAHGNIKLLLELSNIKADELLLFWHFLARFHSIVDQVSDHNTQINVCHCRFFRNRCLVIDRDAIMDCQ